MSSEAALAAVYAIVLLGVGTVLDLLARHTHNRSTRFRTNGFVFLPSIDAWECPEGEHLRRVDADHTARVIRYRARAAVCNSCPAKGDCTDSDAGREIAQSVDPWPHSEAGRFHRGVSIVLVSLAALIAAVAAVRNNSPADLAVLACIFGVAAVVAVRLTIQLIATPSGFPAPQGPG